MNSQIIQPNYSSATGNGGSKAPNKGQNRSQPQKDNPYAKSTGVICYRCNKPGHRSNVYPERKQANLLEAERYDDEEENEGSREDYEGFKFAVEERMDHLALVMQCILLTPKEEGQRNSIFQSLCLINDKVCAVIVDNGSCDNFISKKVIEALKLPTELHVGPYSLGWVKKGPSVHIAETCRVPLSIGKHYKDDVVCDVIDMDAYHILLGRPWHFDVDSTLKGRANILLFTWKNRKIATAPISDSKSSKAKNASFLTLTSDEREMIDDIREADSLFPVVVKGLLSTTQEEVQVPPDVQEILEDFQGLTADELPEELPPMRNIQHQIDLVPGASLPNLPHYWMSPAENEVLREHIEDLLRKGFIRKSMSPCAVPVLLAPKKVKEGQKS